MTLIAREERLRRRRWPCRCQPRDCIVFCAALGCIGPVPTQPRRYWLVTASLTAVVLFPSLGITYSLNLWRTAFLRRARSQERSGRRLRQTMLFPLLVGLHLLLCVFAMWARMTMQRTWRAVVNDGSGPPLAREQPILPARARRWRSCQSGAAHQRRFADRDRHAGRFRHRPGHLVAVCGHLHRGAVDRGRHL